MVRAADELGRIVAEDYGVGPAVPPARRQPRGDPGTRPSGSWPTPIPGMSTSVWTPGTWRTGGRTAAPTEARLLVAALRAAGHRLYSINPKAVNRYRDRHAVSGAKSDPGDALVLADLLRTDRDSAPAAAGRLAGGPGGRACWPARIRIRCGPGQDTNRLRSLLREFFPAALTAFPDLDTKTALTVLAAAPTPAAAARLTRANLVDLLHAARSRHPTRRCGQAGRGLRRAAAPPARRLSKTPWAKRSAPSCAPSRRPTSHQGTGEGATRSLLANTRTPRSCDSLPGLGLDPRRPGPRRIR